MGPKLIALFFIFCLALNNESKIFPKPHSMEKFKNKENIECVAKTIYLEAGNQPKEGKQAVGFVIFNRVKKNNYTLSPCQVIKKHNQFSWRKNVNTHSLEYISCYIISNDIFNNDYDDTTKGALYFMADWAPTPKWLKKKKK